MLADVVDLSDIAVPDFSGAAVVEFSAAYAAPASSSEPATPAFRIFVNIWVPPHQNPMRRKPPCACTVPSGRTICNVQRKGEPRACDIMSMERHSHPSLGIERR